MSEICDRDLFAMPDGSHWGECPICFLPLPLLPSKSMLAVCCSKSICMGCSYANSKREIEGGLEPRCAFCREPLARSEEEADKRVMERIKKNCPAAMCHMGKKRYKGRDFETAMKYYTKAAELGDANAHYSLSLRYEDGQGVEKDMKKHVYHLEQAAIGGHPWARHNLGIYEGSNGRFERARRHFIIAANLGVHESLEGIKKLYAYGDASKED